MSQYQPPIGIDLGTSNSVIGTAENQEFTVLENKRGDRVTPSVVSYDWEADSVHVGKQALNRSVSNPDDTIQSIKREMGSDQTFELGNESHRPEGISALILKKLVQDAEAQLQQPVQNAVITVPAYFSEQQRKATKKAGEIAGLQVDRLIPEPTAACLAYGLQTATEKTVFVYDLGGGTFDCSVVKISDGLIEVVGVDGDTSLGGDDYDGLVVSWMEKQIKQNHGKRPNLSDRSIESRLFEEAKKAKHDLSSRSSTRISLPYIELENGDTANFEQTLTRSKFEEITKGPTEETISICRDFLQEVGLTPSDIDDVLLVGGSTRMPVIQDVVSETFGQEPQLGVNPDTVVAMGATAQACIIQDQPVPSPSSTNIVPKSSSNPGDHLIRGDSQPVLLDVLPQTVGVKFRDQNGDHYFQPLIAKGESIPAQTTIGMRPYEDFQTHTTIQVYQGTERTLSGNEKIDEFTLGPYPPKKKEEQDHQININVDSDGIIYLEALDSNHNIQEDIQIDAEFELSESEMESIETELPALHD